MFYRILDHRPAVCVNSRDGDRRHQYHSVPGAVSRGGARGDIAFMDSPAKALFAVIVVVVVQQLDGNLLSPLVIGKRLNTHPLTIILLLIGAGSFGGILAMILAVPVYAVLKAFVLNIVRLIKLRQRSKLEDSRKPK